MKEKKKIPKKMWDLLIPLLLILCVMPFLIRLAIYSCGYSQYDWYSTNDTLADFYCYYKSYFLEIVAFFAAVILAFRFALYKEKTQPLGPFVPMFLYCGFVLLSTIFSINKRASIEGNFESFESCFVLISYVVLALYAYQMMESDFEYEVIRKGITVIVVLFTFVGLFQVFGYDLLNFEWMQQFIMSAEAYELYGGQIENIFSSNHVYLTLYNPNYAGITLCMLFSITFFVFLSKKGREKIFYGLLSVLLTVLVFFTYSRASLLVLILAGVGMLLVYGRRSKMVLPVIGCIAVILLLVVVDMLMGSPVLSRFAEKNTREPLEEMITDEEGVHIVYDGNGYLIYCEDGSLYCKDEKRNEIEQASVGEEMSLPIEEEAKAELLNKETGEFMLYLCDTTLQFQKENNVYYYKTTSGKLTTMEVTQAADFHGLEYLASARFYIWSRVLPLLNEYILVGSGPDTFAEAFPQEDYAGKIVYADNPERVIEKAHNDYLNKWVQTGLVSLLCVLVFYGYIVFVCGRQLLAAYLNEENRTMTLVLGIGCYFACLCYMLANFFNDSTLQTSPFFYIFTGIVMRSAYTHKTKS